MNLSEKIEKLIEEIGILRESKIPGPEYMEKLKELMYLRRRQIQLNKKGKK